MGSWKVLLVVGLCSTSLESRGSKFAPAAPGETPKCAKKGKSFCEYVDDYPSHVITYLLEQGLFDTNTLFSNEIDSKPPNFNKTSEEEEVVQSRGLPMIRLHHKPLPVRYPGPSHPKYHPPPPVYNSKPNPLFSSQFSKQIYTDYLGYHKRRNHILFPSPTHHARTQSEPIFLGDLAARHINNADHSSKAAEESKPVSDDQVTVDTPYNYKILDGEAVVPEHKDHAMSKLEVPSHAYLPPTSHITVHNTAPALKTHLKLPSHSYLPPVDPNYYRLPKTFHTPQKVPSHPYSPPTKSYLPPKEPSNSYLPPVEPAKSYLPSKPYHAPAAQQLQPAYLQPRHGEDEVQLVPADDVLTIALPHHPTFAPQHTYSPSQAPAHHQYQPSQAPYRALPAPHHPRHQPYQHQPYPSPTPYSSHHAKYPYPQPSPASYHPLPSPYPRHHSHSPYPQHPSPTPQHTIVHSLPARKKFSIAEFLKAEQEHGLEQNEVTFSNKARLQAALKTVQVEEERQTDKKSVEVTKNTTFEKLRIASKKDLQSFAATTSKPVTTTTETTTTTTTTIASTTQLQATTPSTMGTTSKENLLFLEFKIEEEQSSTTERVNTVEAKITANPKSSSPSNHVRFPQDSPKPKQSEKISAVRIPAVPFGPQLPPHLRQQSGTISFKRQQLDPILQESLTISARGGRTVRPRSFTPAPPKRAPGTHTPNSVKRGAHPPQNPAAQGVFSATGELAHSLEQAAFSGAGPHIGGFREKVNSGSHSYRLTTPSSHVFVQRNFATTPQPSKRETVLGRKSSKTKVVAEEESKELPSPGQHKKDEEESVMYKTLKDAVDVLTRSSLGFMYQQPEDINAEPSEVMTPEVWVDVPTKPNKTEQLVKLSIEEESLQDELDEVQQELRHEFHILQQQLGGEGEISLRIPQESTGHGAAFFEDGLEFPLQTLFNQDHLSFEHFPVQNIYDKEAIRKALESMEDEQDFGESTDNVAVIEKEQFDDILLTNYLKNSLKGSDSESAMLLKSLPKPISANLRENNHEEREPRNFRPSSEENRIADNFEKEELVLVPYNSTVYIPVEEMETINVGDSTERNSLDIENSNEFVQYMPAPALSTVATDNTEDEEEVAEDAALVHEELMDLLTAENKAVEKLGTWGDNLNINLTFQDKWIGHSESPVEVERKKRQLEEVKREQMEHHGRQRRGADEVVEASEVLLDELERDVVKELELEQEFTALMEEEDDQERDRRQTSDPDQLCPTVSSFVMPRAGVNAKGNWMYIVNMPDDTQYQQLVRAEICISDSCRGLCDVPFGLTTKCSQQFVQKKLVALDPSGDKLVEDMFWFPSCCVCQVARENRA